MVDKVALALLAMQRQSWEQGVTMQAFFELGRDDVLFALAKESAYRSLPDGRVAMVGAQDGSTDPCSAGEGLQHTLDTTGDDKIKQACKALENWAVHNAPRNEQGIVYHLTNRPEFWVDSMYMLPPYLAAIGHPQLAVQQISGYWDALYNPQAGLMSHMWDDGKKQFIRSDFWGVGNGWTTSGLARVIDLLPENMNDARDDLIHKGQKLVNKLLEYIRADGQFHDVVNDPSSFVEVNLSQMLAYTIFRASASGWAMDGWLDKAEIMRKAAHSQVDSFGLVQNVCGAPNFDRPGVAPEGQAFFLLMEAAAGKL